jgi:hypothetical protein
MYMIMILVVLGPFFFIAVRSRHGHARRLVRLLEEFRIQVS